MRTEKYRTSETIEKQLLSIGIRYYPTVEISGTRKEFTEYQLMLRYKNRFQQVYLKSLSKFQILKSLINAILRFRKELKYDKRTKIYTTTIQGDIDKELKEYNNFIKWE